VAKLGYPIVANMVATIPPGPFIRYAMPFIAAYKAAGPIAAAANRCDIILSWVKYMI